MSGDALYQLYKNPFYRQFIKVEEVRGLHWSKPIIIGDCHHMDHNDKLHWPLQKLQNWILEEDEDPEQMEVEMAKLERILEREATPSFWDYRVDDEMTDLWPDLM
jgi:hypothetical protein